MTRAAALLGVLSLLSGCAPDAVPRTVTVRADSTLGPVLTAVMPLVQAEHPGLTVRLDTASAGPADLVLGTEPPGYDGEMRGDGLRLARASLVVVGHAGAAPSPTLESALSAARTIGVGRGIAVSALTSTLLAGVSPELSGRVVRFETTQAALDSVAARATDIAFALAPDALAANAYAVVYRPTDAEVPPAVVTGVLRPGASPDARTVLDALAAPTAYRAWAAAGFRPPPAPP